MGNGRKGKNHKARRPLVKPSTLTKAQRELWDETVDSQSTAWLVAGMEPLLHAYVVSACYLRVLYGRRELAIADPDSTAREITAYDVAIGAEVRNVAMLMTRLRLTPQSRTKETDPQSRPAAPWEQFPEDNGDTA